MNNTDTNTNATPATTGVQDAWEPKTMADVKAILAPGDMLVRLATSETMVVPDAPGEYESFISTRGTVVFSNDPAVKTGAYIGSSVTAGEWDDVIAPAGRGGVVIVIANRAYIDKNGYLKAFMTTSGAIVLRQGPALPRAAMLPVRQDKETGRQAGKQVSKPAAMA